MDVHGSTLRDLGTIVANLLWRWRPRRPREPGFPYVYVEFDGTVRELSRGERSDLMEEIHPPDSPYIKWHYGQKDGWGSIGGFLKRRRVPKHIPILPVHPDYDARVAKLEARLGIKVLGHIITKNEDGTTTAKADPDFVPGESFERARQAYLEECRERAKLARADDCSD